MFIIAVILGPGDIWGQTTAKWHNEAVDTTKITTILINEASQSSPGNVSRIGRFFLDTPYVGGTLDNDSIEYLQVNLDGMDCTTFVETVAALALTAREKRQSWQDFIYNLESIRYRNGRLNGYPSRLHYVSGWILDNSTRGNIREITPDLPGVRYQIKSLDYMSRHRDSYPLLADSANYAGIKSMESGFSNYRYPHLKGNTLKNKDLIAYINDGDIIIITSNADGLDATHMGIAVKEDGTVKFMHASSKAQKVTIDELSLADYLRRTRADGIRVLRLQ